MQKASASKNNENVQNFTINVDTGKKIQKVAVCVQEGATNAKATEMFGIKLVDTDDQVVAIVNYEKEAEFTTYNVPEGYEIIGCYMSMAGCGYALTDYENDAAINCFGFVLWKPNPNARD